MKRNPGKKLALLALAAVLSIGAVPAAAMAEPASSASASAVTSASAETASTDSGLKAWPEAPEVYSKAAVVMDADTGAILYSRNMDEKMYPASVTKIMTCLLALEKGNPDDQVEMTDTGVAYAVSGSSNLNTKTGEIFTLKDMLYAVMLKSANDIATQVGEYIGGGSLDKFIDMMNERALELGCTSTTFHNACGMPDEQHMTSAHDLALISQAALKNEDFRTIIHTVEYTIPATNMSEARTIRNHHPLLADAQYAYDGIIGGKTGYTDAAGNCLASFAERDGMTIICVTLKANGVAEEIADATALLDYAFDNFESVTYDPGSGKVNTDGGKVTIPKTVSSGDLTAKEGSDGKTTLTYSGTVVGEATLTEQPESSVAESAAQSETAVKTNGTKTGSQASTAGRTLNAAFMAISVLLGFSLIGLLAIFITVFLRSRR
jgi:D-alanyl-D-alanine carboxypeptidase (penicillin-binding protein 5/6)